MNILKPQAAFAVLKLNSNDDKFHLFDVRKMYKRLVKGRLRKSLLDYELKNNYDKLPKICRYFISESEFVKLKFDHNIFYDYNEDEKIILIDYCNEMLRMYPSHKKTNKLLNDLKQENPELFI